MRSAVGARQSLDVVDQGKIVDHDLHMRAVVDLGTMPMCPVIADRHDQLVRPVRLLNTPDRRGRRRAGLKTPR